MTRHKFAKEFVVGIVRSEVSAGRSSEADFDRLEHVYQRRDIINSITKSGQYRCQDVPKWYLKVLGSHEVESIFP